MEILNLPELRGAKLAVGTLLALKLVTAPTISEAQEPSATTTVVEANDQGSDAAGEDFSNVLLISLSAGAAAFASSYAAVLQNNRRRR